MRKKGFDKLFQTREGHNEAIQLLPYRKETAYSLTNPHLAEKEAVRHYIEVLSSFASSVNQKGEIIIWNAQHFTYNSNLF